MAGITRRGYVAALCAVGALAAACSNVNETADPTTGPGTSATPRAPLSSREPVVQSSMIATFIAGGMGVDNLVRGTLEEQDGCLVFSAGDVGPSIPVFARDEWLVADDYVADANREYRAGDEIEGRNSIELDPDQADEISMMIPESCQALTDLPLISLSPNEPHRSLEPETSDPRSHGGVGGH